MLTKPLNGGVLVKKPSLIKLCAHASLNPLVVS